MANKIEFSSPGSSVFAQSLQMPPSHVIENTGTVKTDRFSQLEVQVAELTAAINKFKTRPVVFETHRTPHVIALHGDHALHRTVIVPGRPVVSTPADLCAGTISNISTGKRNAKLLAHFDHPTSAFLDSPSN
jgi:hypothetical protein